MVIFDGLEQTQSILDQHFGPKTWMVTRYISERCERTRVEIHAIKSAVNIGGEQTHIRGDGCDHFNALIDLVISAARTEKNRNR